MQKDAKIKFSQLKVDGGASINDLLMQIQSNLLETLVVRPKITETTALGIAFLSGLGSGFWKSIDDLKSVWIAQKEFQPDPNFNGRKIMENWKLRISNLN